MLKKKMKECPIKRAWPSIRKIFINQEMLGNQKNKMFKNRKVKLEKIVEHFFFVCSFIFSSYFSFFA